MQVIEKSNWVSVNGLWKVSYTVQGENRVLVSDVSIMKSAGRNIWKDISNTKIPKYVGEKHNEAKERIQAIKMSYRCKHRQGIELIEIAGTTESIALCRDCKNEV